MSSSKWPKILPPLTAEQQRISDDFMKHWHEVLAGQARYGLIEKFNHGYPVKHSDKDFLSTLEIGAGLGEHLDYEILTEAQQKNYVAVELRANMAQQFQERHPNIRIHVGDCQQTLPFADNHFDRIIAIHVLEHLPNLPAAVKEMHRLCHKQKGQFYVVIPCEGGLAYTIARKISAQRIFEKRYQQPYHWFISREHINKADEVIEELNVYFRLDQKQFFPFLLPSIHLNLCIGMVLRPR